MMSPIEDAMGAVRMVLLRDLSNDTLLNIVAHILSRPGSQFSPGELDELAAINAEFMRRDKFDA